MGAVYEGMHIEIGKRVAIKTLSPALAAMPDARARFLREAQLTSRVRHPHIVDVTDIGSEAGHTYLVMEFLDGEDLAQRIERRGPLPLDEIADIMLPVLAAVAAAHDEGIIHRDLKPQNIFLSQTRDGAIVPKVLDFGISKGPSELQPRRFRGWRVAGQDRRADGLAGICVARADRGDGDGAARRAISTGWGSSSTSARRDGRRSRVTTSRRYSATS